MKKRNKLYSVNNVCFGECGKLPQSKCRQGWPLMSPFGGCRLMPAGDNVRRVVSIEGKVVVPPESELCRHIICYNNVQKDVFGIKMP